MTSGVYAITCQANGRCYIGATKHIEGRFAKHRAQLRHGKHPSQPFQEDWDLYGSSVFDLTIIEKSLPDSQVLAARERHYIEARHTQAGPTDYHRRHGAGLGLTVQAPEETRRIILSLLNAIENRGGTATLREIAKRSGKSIMMVRHVLVQSGLWTPDRVAAAKRQGVERSHAHPDQLAGIRERGQRNLSECLDRKRKLLTVSRSSGSDVLSLAEAALVLGTVGLSEREATVLRLRFGESLSLHEVGLRVGVTRERVRQVEDAALNKLSSLQRETA